MKGLMQVRWRTALGSACRLVLIVVVLVVALATLAVATLDLYVFGDAGAPPKLVWLTATLVLSGAGGALAWLIFPRHPRRTAAIAIFAVVGVAAGIALRVATPPNHSQLAGAVASVELPAGATLVEELERGTVLCFDGCPTILHLYAVPGQAQDVERTLAAAFRADGWSVVPERYMSRGFTAYSPDAALEASVIVAPEPRFEPHGTRPQLPTVAAGHVLVEVNVAGPVP